MWGNGRHAIRIVAVAVVATFGAWAPMFADSAPAHAAAKPHLKAIEYHPTPTATQRAAAQSTIAAAKVKPTTIPFWQHTFTDGVSGHQFSDTLVGADPATSNKTTTIKTTVIPVAFQIAGGNLYDPTVPSPCTNDPKNIPTKKTLASPIFKTADYTVGGTDLGKGQAIDEFRRAEFWDQTGGGANPKYHTKLAPKLAKKITVNVPAGSGEDFSFGGPCTMGMVDVNWLEPYIENTLIPQLGAAKVLAPTQFALFLTSNVVSYDGVPHLAHCCIIGFHYFAPNPSYNNVEQTYGISDYDTLGLDFWGGGLTDTSVMAHEVGEWMDDPFGDNLVDPWGHIGQQPDCQNNFEVGDPLSGTWFTVNIGKSTYHVQELAFNSWFYRLSPSGGVNGWYSFNGSFTTPAAECS
jgi:hypothetical protein